MRKILYLVLAALGCTGLGFMANTATAQNYSNHLTVTRGIRAETDLPELPGKIVSGDLEFEKSYYVGLTYARTMKDNFTIPVPFTTYRTQGWALEPEGTLLRHYNIQTNWEATIALVLRTRRFKPFTFLGWTLALGDGFSYAFGDPELEKGPDGLRGQDQVQLQNHLVLEIDFFHPDYSRVHLVGRVHHRSGVYGLISSAPRRRVPIFWPGVFALTSNPAITEPAETIH